MTGRKIYTWCDECEKKIFAEEKIWYFGASRYCQGKCLVDAMKSKKEKKLEIGGVK